MNFLLRVSLVLNAVLLLVAMSRMLSGRPGPGPADAPMASESAAARAVTNAESPTELRNFPDIRKGWDWIESSDHQRLIANMREVGCPEATIQELVCLRLCRSMRQRLLDETGRQQRSVLYWRSPSAEEKNAQFSLHRRLLNELGETLEDLFGEDGMTIRMRVAGLPHTDQPYEYLPPDKAMAVRKVTRSFDSLEQELREFDVPFGWIDPDSRARQNELEREKLVALSQVLTPAEYELYLHRSSSAADYVRRSLPEAQSEEAFRQMVKVALEFEKSRLDAREPPHYIIDDPNDASVQARKEEERAFRERLAEELGGNRLAEQEELDATREREQRETEGRARSIAEITEIGATEEEAGRLLDRLMAMQPKMDARAKETLPENPTREQKDAFEAFVKAELEHAATEILGAEKARKLIKKFEREARR